MAVTDARAKHVVASLLDQFSVNASLFDLFTDPDPSRVSPENAESFDIATRAAVTIEDASSSGAPTSMSVQTINPTPNRLVIDRHKGAIVQMAPVKAHFDLQGGYFDQLARQIRVELQNYLDGDSWDEAIEVGAWDTSATYWVNAAGATLTNAMTLLARAKMLDQKGVQARDCVWVFDAFADGAIRALASFDADRQPLGSLGYESIGTLHGIPVVIGQSITRSHAVATTAVTVASNVATATVAAGHGIVPGMLITTSGHTTNATTAVAVTSVTATTIVYPLTASDGALADGVGTITCALTRNGLLHRPWAFAKKAMIPEVKIVAQAGQIGDELQTNMLYGVKMLAGSVIGIGSPAGALTA